MKIKTLLTYLIAATMMISFSTAVVAAGKSEKSEKSEKSFKSAKSAKSDKSDKSAKSRKSRKSDKSNKSDKSAKSEKSEKSKKSGKGASCTEDVSIIATTETVVDNEAIPPEIIVTTFNISYTGKVCTEQDWLALAADETTAAGELCELDPFSSGTPSLPALTTQGNEFFYEVDIFKICLAD